MPDVPPGSQDGSWLYWGEDQQGLLRWLLNQVLPPRLSFALQPNQLGVLPEHTQFWNETTGAWVSR